MSNDSSRDTRRDLLTAASAIGLGAFVSETVKAAAQDDARLVRSKKASEEAVVGNNVVKSADYNEAKNHSLIQVIEHVFKEDEDPAAGYPVTRVKEFKVRADTKLAIVTVSGFEFWFGTKEQEIMIGASRKGVHAALEAELGRGTLTVKVRANSRRSGRPDHEWTWRCHVMVQCFGER
ncbi:MAG: hypothetical protein ACHRXM_02035 [Isosphaerales bacterium]